VGNIYVPWLLRELFVVMFVPRVVHFEVSAEKPERAVKFYEKVFGWKIVKWEGPVEYWLITTGKQGEPGIDGGLGKREAGDEAGTVNTIDVPSVDEFAKKVEQNGGKVVVPKHAIPGVGWIAYFKDSEGNMFGIMQDDPSAK
jgi:predicted enzyme related to lactoylglutathione lyase